MVNLVSGFGSLLGVLGSDKSFRQNPILGNAYLNDKGLHRKRVQLAAALASGRRSKMARRLPVEDVAAFERDGFIQKYPALPVEDFRALKSELLATALPTKEMRQGPTTTRMAPLSNKVPLARAYAQSTHMRRLMGYAAGRAGAPVMFLQTVLADAAEKTADPQTAMHSDTFHSTAKMWLFLEDVGEEDGPFVYVPGSHRLTPERLEWEYTQSLTAKADPRLHHSLGSFRVGESDLSDLGYGPPRPFAAKANTLIIADTYGFHKRAPSHKENKRLELHGYLRSNPFVPWNGLQGTSLPLIAENQAEIWFWYLSRRERKGKPGVWKDIGDVVPDF
ncbi:MAG: phytanoyl-CoA dioxygenase family protein [Pseudomonadota bacterium]